MGDYLGLSKWRTEAEGKRKVSVSNAMVRKTEQATAGFENGRGAP